MRFIRGLIEAIAPYQCLGCKQEGDLLCESCRLSLLVEPPSHCGYCLKLSPNYETCVVCKSHFPLDHVWLATSHDGVARELIVRSKFGSARGGCRVMARCLSDALPAGARATLIVSVPTISSHIRRRGYDHAHEIAKNLSSLLGIPPASPLYRLDQQTQLGATRAERLENLKRRVIVRDASKYKGQHILLVDDVITTGASLAETARVLRRAGAVSVDGLVFARA